MGLRGEWWLDTYGNATFADGDVGDLNHGIMAFYAALGLDYEDPAVDVYPGKPFTPAQVQELLALDADPEAVEYLKSGRKDARDFVMRFRGWIRVADNTFQLLDLDDTALKHIQDFINAEYPEDENPLEDDFVIEEVKPGGLHLRLVGQELLESGKNAAALKYSAQRERPEWHNPAGKGKPSALGDIWTASAKIKIQDMTVDPPRWKTLAVCMDTPAAIGACISKNNLHGDLWVFGEASGKQYLGRRNPEGHNPGTNSVQTLPTGTILYHGSPEPYATEILRTGKLVSRSGRKMGGGTMEEGGLLWFARTAAVAKQWAEGTEARPGDFTGPGQVFRIKLTKPAKIISRYAELTAQQAQVLNSVLGIPDYKPVKAGDRLSVAASRAFESSQKPFEKYGTQRGEMRVIWPVILKALGVDGFEYDGTIAVAADQLDLE